MTAVAVSLPQELWLLAQRPGGWVLPLLALLLLALGVWVVFDVALARAVCRMRGRHVFGMWRPVNPQRLKYSGPTPHLRGRACALCGEEELRVCHGDGLVMFPEEASR